MSGTTIEIGDRIVGGDAPAYVIAEVGSNHNGDLDLAKKHVVAAQKCGCDCVKFQTFTAETFCSEKDKTFSYLSQGRMVTEPMYDMFKRLELERDEWAELMAFCDELNIFFMTTVQDPVDLEMMLDLGLQAIKAGSDEFDNLANLKLFAETGLPLIISKGMADAAEVDRTLAAIAPLTRQLAVLHCVSIYPSEPSHLNLRQIPNLAERHPEVVWGFSDHSRGTLGSTVAVGLGAKIIEKHFTLDHDLPGADHWFSMNPTEMETLVRDIRVCEQALGSGEIVPHQDEAASRDIMRRRIVARRDLDQGTILGDEDVLFKRADNGLFLSDWEDVRGRRLKTSVPRDHGVESRHLDEQ